MYEHMIVSSTTLSSGENTLIIRINIKAGLVREKNIVPFTSPPDHVCFPLLYGCDGTLLCHNAQHWLVSIQIHSVGFEQFESKLWYQ